MWLTDLMACSVFPPLAWFVVELLQASARDGGTNTHPNQ